LGEIMNDSRLIELAIHGLEATRNKIDGEITELRSRIGGALETVAEAVLPPAPKNGRRARKRKKGRKPLSEEGRRAISEAAKRRWAARRRAAK
jgi:hypothetical protein